MGGRRSLPLVLAVLLGTALVLLRLWQIQVVEHDVWSEQARKLQHSGEVMPYVRGAIRDAHGDALVRDARVYGLELCYRDFRREHPLGQIAHARTALEMRPVGLAEARSWMRRWGTELVGLSPAGLYEFARGAELETRSFYEPETEEPYAQQRPLRASDLRFYVRRLLGLSRAENGRLVKLERSTAERRSYLEIVAGWRGLGVEELAVELEETWDGSMQRLGTLAEGLELVDELVDERVDQAGEPVSPAPRPLDLFLADLERWRGAIENAAASRLFRDVAGFAAGRLDDRLLLSRLDLDWMSRQMRWDAARLADWAAQARFNWLRSWREGYALPRVLAEVQLTEASQVDAHFILSMLGSLHGGGLELQLALDGEPVDWRRLSPPQLLIALPGLFANGALLPEGPPLLPILDAQLVEDSKRMEGFELLTDERLLEPGRAASIAAEFIAEVSERTWSARYKGRLAEVWAAEWDSPAAAGRDRIRRLGVGLLDSWEVRLQRALREALDALAAGDEDGRLTFAEDRLDRIAERARHLLRDHGSRSVALHRDPDYVKVVYRITLEPDHFPGFRIRSGSEREPVPFANTDKYLAAELLGAVGSLDAAWVQRQREAAALLRELQRSPSRTGDENRLLGSLMQDLLLDGESLGVSGIERYCDVELRGSNGYRERLGLEDVYGEGARSVLLSEVQDGGDVQLTLEPLLQFAASETINHPTYPEKDPDSDREWFTNPVGAIVLMTPDGRVLAAASAPDINVELPEGVEGQRGNVIDRTLRAPTFQPVGSVFKPLVAVQALSRLDPVVYSDRFTYNCGSELRDGRPSCGGVRCWSRSGHGEVDLARAIRVSCNTYFAAVADLMTIDDLYEVGTAFGYGQPTGIASIEGRRGLSEADIEIMVLSREMDTGRQRRLAANGLQIVQGTPMQVARAMATLATGELPAVRLIDSINGQLLPQPDPVPVPYPDWALATVRTAMLGVTNDLTEGSGTQLSKRATGYEIAAKTGSADLTGGSGVVRKHTWIGGWLPARDPEIVFCVFVHDTMATSSHTSVPIMEQLLKHDLVRIWLANRGVEASR